jgi:hypothetical protein
MRFMGSIISQQGQAGLPEKYLNGVAVYPNNAIEIFDKIPTIKDGTQAWDIGSTASVVPRAMNTPLIFHFYGLKDMPPIFVSAKAPDAPKNHVTLDFVPLQAAVFHRSKDGGLIDLLRARRNAVPETKTVVVAELFVEPKSEPVVDMLPPNLSAPEIDTPQPEKRGPGRPRKVEGAA